MSSKKAKKTETKTIDYDALVNALKAIKISKQSIRVAAAAFGMSKTSLARYVQKFDKEGKDIANMTDAEIDALVRKNESSDEDQDFCIICSQFLPRNMMNTVACMRKCGIVVHKKCAQANAARFICEHCDPDLDEFSEEFEEDAVDE